MQGSKKFAFDVGITFIASVATIPLGFIITILLARYLGAGDLGLYRMTSTLYGLAMLIAVIGIPAAMIKYVAEFKEDRNKFNQIVSSGIITSVFSGIIFITLFYFSSGIFAEIFNMPGLTGLLKILSPVFPFALVSGALLGLLNGIREMKKYAAATIIQSVLMVIVTVALIYSGFGVAGAVIGIVLSAVGNCLFLIGVSRKYFKITLSEYVPVTKKMLKFGAQIFGANAINMINTQLDIILIGFFLTSTELGYYSIAISLSGLLMLLPTSIQKITYPATSSYWSENNHGVLNNMLNKSMKYCTVILVLLGLGIGFFAKDIIIFLFKEDFVYAVLPLQILLIGTVIRGSISKPIGGSLSGIGRPDLVLKIHTFMIAINAAFDIILIPQIGIVGAAIATTISLAGGAFINLGLIIKHLPIKVDIRWYLGILGVALMAIALFKFNMVFVNPFLLGGAVLIGCSIIIFRFFLTEEDKDLFKSLTDSLIRWR